MLIILTLKEMHEIGNRKITVTQESNNIDYNLTMTIDLKFLLTSYNNNPYPYSSRSVLIQVNYINNPSTLVVELI